MNSGTNTPTTIILPTDVDDINGYGVQQALELCGIDRDTEQTLADMIEERWWNLYRHHAAEALTAAGWNVILADGSIGSPEVYDLERRHADDLAEVDGLPCDMSAVSHAATDDLWAWWQANAATLIAEHGAPRCVICGDVEETCDCVLVGQSPDEVRSAIAERMGDSATDAQADAMIELLEVNDRMARNDNGLVFLAPIDEHEWLDMIDSALMSMHTLEVFREAVRAEVEQRNVTTICRGYAWELFRDGYEPSFDALFYYRTSAGSLAVIDEAARQAVDAWLAMTPAERAAR